MGFSFPQVHILHGRGLHIWEACNNVIIICLLYMNKTNTGRYIYTRIHTFAQELAVWRYFRVANVLMEKKLVSGKFCRCLQVCKCMLCWRPHLVTTHVSGGDYYHRPRRSGWSSWYWSRGKITGVGMRWRSFVVICPRSVGSLWRCEQGCFWRISELFLKQTGTS